MGIFYNVFKLHKYLCTLHEVGIPQDFKWVSTRFFELRYFLLFAPLKHCARAEKLSEKVCKVLEQLPSTFFSNRTLSFLRRLKVGVKGAL